MLNMQEVSIARLARLIRRLGLAGLLKSVLFHYAGAPLAKNFPARSQKAIRSFLAHHDTEKILIMSSTLDWSFPYRQRVHHLAEALADLGWKIIFVSPSSGYDRFMTHIPRGNILVMLDLSAALNIIEKPLLYFISADNRPGTELLEEQKKRGGRIIYDYLDAIDSKVSNTVLTPARIELHNALLTDEKTCFCIATAKELQADIEKARTRNHAFITNGVDVPHFRATRRREGLRPDFRVLVERERPLIGYYGALASWFDYELVNAVAEGCPDLEVVLVGPDYDGSLRQAQLNLPNLHVLESIDYDDLPRHAVWFDVALIPFVINKITKATSPLKLFEYMSLGLPIVSTDIPEARAYRSVRVARTHGEFTSHVKDLIQTGPSAEELELLAGEAEENDWLAKARHLDTLITDFLGIPA